ncbi:MAG: hypothetical protein IKL05_06460 [Clostridia bacterium]|nr:hypothetical protein [Clostridia bacterium]
MENEKKKSLSWLQNKSLIWRFVSLLCAILLWFYVSAVESPTSEKNFDSVAITLRNKDVLLTETDLSVISDAIYEADIVLSGKKSTLNKIDYEDIVATVDLSKLTEAGSHELSVSVTAPSGTTVVSTNPRYITVAIDKTVAKSFDIEPEISYNNLPSSYEMGECVVTDSQAKAVTSVTVSGPATEIERIDKVVARVDFGSLTSSVEAKTNLVCLDYYGEEISNTNVRLTPQSVIVKQPIYVTKKLNLTVSQANNTFTDSQISFKIRPSSVEVKGDPKILEELNEITLDPINERSIGEALTTTVNSLIKLPEGLELVSMQNTATITASLRNVKCHYLKVSPKNLKIVNMPDFLDIEFEEIDWTLVVINASNKSVSLDDIELELDLANFISSGIYTVNLSPKFKESTAYAYFPYDSGYEVSFELTKK